MAHHLPFRLMRNTSFAIALAVMASHCRSPFQSQNLAAGSSPTEAPPSVAVPVAAPLFLAKGFVGRSCVKLDAGEVWCWGSFETDRRPPEAPQRIEALMGTRQVLVDAYLSGLHYVLDSRSAVSVWGKIHLDGATLFQANPPRPVPGWENVAEIENGINPGPVAARHHDGTVSVCMNHLERDSITEQRVRFTACKPSPLPEIKKAIDLDGDCALEANGDIKCWETTAVPNKMLVTLSGKLDGAVELAACSLGGSTVCARDKANNIVCLGENEHGQLGDGTFQGNREPRKVKGIVDAKQVTCAFKQIFVVTNRGELWTWGGTNHMNPPERRRPMKFAKLRDIVDFRQFQELNCVLRKDGALGCWGRYDERSVGEGDPRDPAVLEPQWLRVGEPIGH